MTAIEKLKEHFGEMIVFKNQNNSSIKDLGLPSFLRDWVLKKFEDEDGNFDFSEIKEFADTYLPAEDEWNAIKSRIINDERVKILTKIVIDVDTKTGEINFSLPKYGLSVNESIIEPHVWEEYKDNLIKGETWGIVELGYIRSEDKKKGNRVKLVSFTDFCPYTVELDYYKEARKEFTIDEWLDVILGAIDYNAAGYKSEKQKIAMIKRLIPFVEKNINFIELAPKGTAKSYVFGGISRFGYLATGTMTRAKLFHDMGKRGVNGLVQSYDFVAFDEIQKFKFPNANETTATLMSYAEQGKFSLGNYQGEADAGIVFLGNIEQRKMNEYKNMFGDFPEVFRGKNLSGLLDRFHGFIKGWEIPRMDESLKISGWALNSEYFSTILHLLRKDISYRSIVDSIIEIPENADTRDTEAVKRIASALLKLLFPHVQSVGDINKKEFLTYCLKPAKQMRQIIKLQMGLLDEEFQGKDVPDLKLREDI